jgi:hypothetical protein
MTGRHDHIGGRRELDRRTSDGLEVTLFWAPADDGITVTVVDTNAGDAFELAVDPSEALDAFHHPYAYAAFRGVAYHVPRAAGAAVCA